MKNKYWVFFLATIVLSLFLRLINLNQSFWLDEAAQVIESARPLSQQLKIAADFHPPFFHIILHFWMYISHSEIWVRMLSVFLAVGSILLLYGISDKKNKNVSLLSAFLLAVSPYHIWYSQEARPYMLFVFLTLLSSVFLLKRKWGMYILSVVFLVYSLYFWPFVLLSHFLYIIIKDRRYIKNFAISAGFGAAFFIPWVPYFIFQLKTGLNGMFSGWTGVVSFGPLKAVGLMFAKFILGKGSIENNILYAAILFPIFTIFVIANTRIILSKKYSFPFLFFWISLVSSVFISVFIPILAPQRLLFLLPFFYLILADYILSVSKKFSIILIIIITVIELSGTLQYWIDPNVQREQWRQSVNFIENDSKRTNNAAIFVFPDPFAPYLWYQHNEVKALGIAPDFILKDSDLISLHLKLSGVQKVYDFQYLSGLTDPTNKVDLFLLKDGFVKTDTKNFPGVGFIYIYEKI